MNPPDIEFALENIKSPDTVAQEAGRHYLLCKFEPLIHKMAYLYCREVDPSDATQSGNLGILKAIESYNGTSLFCTWVYTCVRHELQKQSEICYPVKVSRFLKKQGCKASFEELIDNRLYHSPVETIMKSEEGYRISDALATINRTYSERDCRIFVAYYFENIPLKILSERYNVNAAAIVRGMILAIRAQIKDKKDKDRKPLSSRDTTDSCNKRL